MSLKTWIHRKKQETYPEKSQEKKDFVSLSPEERNLLAMETAGSYEMLPLGGLPSGSRHFY